MSEPIVLVLDPSAYAEGAGLRRGCLSTIFRVARERELRVTVRDADSVAGRILEQVLAAEGLLASGADDSQGNVFELDGHVDWEDAYSKLRARERKAEVLRDTSETKISVKLNLDGSGRGAIRTGLGFFDHMLDQVAKHSGCDLELSCEGDLHIDEHHTIEDSALALGSAFKQALGDKRGVERYAFVIPMDEAEARVSLDFSGRPWCVWNAEFRREKIGEMPTEMFFHFFKSFTDTSGCTLHIEAFGDNEHHKIESIFKSFARCLKRAVRRTGKLDELPSTKGVL